MCVLNSRFTKFTSLQSYFCSQKRDVLMASLVTFVHGNLQQMYVTIQPSKQKLVRKRCRKGSIAEAHTAVAVTGYLRTCTFETQFEDLLSRQWGIFAGVMIFCQYGKLARRKLFFVGLNGMKFFLDSI